MRSTLILLILFFFCSSHVTAEESRFDPQNDRDCVDLSDHEEKTPSAAPESFFINGIGLYQRYISPVIGNRCQMYPSCSAYSILAIKKHGILIGTIMTFDRLIHEIGESSRAPICKHNDRFLFYDSVEENDFWWADKK